MTNRVYSYGVLAVLQVLWATILFFMIDEPDIFSEAEARREKRKTFCGKLWSKLRQAWKACKSDSALTVSLVGLTTSRVSAQLQQVTFQNWIDSFGLPNTKEIWQKQNLVANLCGLPMVFVAGMLTDKVSAKIMVPASFTFQLAVMAGYMFCTQPDGAYAYFLAVF